jgi:hypothetical protein
MLEITGTLLQRGDAEYGNTPKGQSCMTDDNSGSTDSSPASSF